MITGKVTANREAVIEMEIIGPTKQTQRVEVVIDTGFNGYLTLLGFVGRFSATPAATELLLLGRGKPRR